MYLFHVNLLQAVISKECELKKKEEGLLLLQGKLASKEFVSSDWVEMRPCFCCLCKLSYLFSDGLSGWNSASNG